MSFPILTFLDDQETYQGYPCINTGSLGPKELFELKTTLSRDGLIEGEHYALSSGYFKLYVLVPQEKVKKIIEADLQKLTDSLVWTSEGPLRSEFLELY